MRCHRRSRVYARDKLKRDELKNGMTCPNCQSEKTRRGGNTTWLIYLALIVAGLIAVLLFRQNAAIVAGIMIAVVIITNLVISERICLDCGHQWRAK